MASKAAGSRSGCGVRGYLIGCLVPIALLVIGFVLVRPTLQEQWTRWRAENPG